MARPVWIECPVCKPKLVNRAMPHCDHCLWYVCDVCTHTSSIAKKGLKWLVTRSARTGAKPA